MININQNRASVVIQMCRYFCWDKWELKLFLNRDRTKSFSGTAGSVLLGLRSWAAGGRCSVTVNTSICLCLVYPKIWFNKEQLEKNCWLETHENWPKILYYIADTFKNHAARLLLITCSHICFFFSGLYGENGLLPVASKFACGEYFLTLGFVQ